MHLRLVLASLLFLQAACVDVTKIPLMGGTTVVSSESDQLAFIFGDHPKSFLSAFDRVSHFDCPPERYGLVPGAVDFTGVALVPDTVSRGELGPLPIAQPLAQMSDGPLGIGDKLVEVADVPPVCSSSTSVVTWPRDRGSPLLERHGADGTQFPDPRQTLAIYGECLEAALLDSDGQSSLSIETRAETSTLAVPSIRRLDSVFMALDCSPPYPRVVLVGETLNGRVHLWLVSVPSPGGPQLEQFDIGAAFPWSTFQAAFDPLDRGRVYVWRRSAELEETVLEFVDSEVHVLDFDFVRLVGAGLLLVSSDEAVLRTSEGEARITVCDRPDRVVDLVEVPGRWLYVTAEGFLGESPVHQPCLDGEVRRRVSAGARARLIGLPTGVVLAQAPGDSPYISVKGWYRPADPVFRTEQ